MQAIYRPKDEASAAATYVFTCSFGMAIGVDTGGSIFQNVMKEKLQHFGLPTEIADHLEAYIATLRTLPDSSVLKTQVLQAYISRFEALMAPSTGSQAWQGLPASSSGISI